MCYINRKINGSITKLVVYRNIDLYFVTLHWIYTIIFTLQSICESKGSNLIIIKY